ncbi:MAG: hypothetical protein LBE32_03405 [Burkholderiales bacterium]|jgi:hypothetical protein|nr:hypothetical protein [Burkholderiales bacterium]
MKRFLSHTLGGAALALSFSFSAPVLAQETFAYPDDFPPRTLQSIDTGGLTWSDALTTSVDTVNGAHKSTFVTGNTVTLNSGTVRYVYGAVNYGDTDGVSGNSVVINGGTVDILVTGADHDPDNGNTSATNNSVEINGGTVRDVYGGIAKVNGSGDTLASNNTVAIMGGTASGEVCGGYAGGSSGHQAEASNNTVRIGPGLPTTVFGSNVTLSGGRTSGGDIGVSTGNTLQIESAGLSVQHLGHFQRFEFTLPAGLVNGGRVLTVTATVNIGTNAVMTVSAAPGFTVSPGDAFILIDGTGSTFSGTVAAASQSGTIGGYPYTLAVENGTAVVLRILQPVQSRAVTSVPVAGGGVLAALGLLLAGLAAAGLRRRR